MFVRIHFNLIFFLNLSALGACYPSALFMREHAPPHNASAVAVETHASGRVNPQKQGCLRCAQVHPPCSRMSKGNPHPHALRPATIAGIPASGIRDSGRATGAAWGCRLSRRDGRAAGRPRRAMRPLTDMPAVSSYTPTPAESQSRCAYRGY
jgi:hypothetical protein